MELEVRESGRGGEEGRETGGGGRGIKGGGEFIGRGES